MPTVADQLVNELLGAGVRTLFGVPGGAGNLDLIDAARRAGLRFVLTSTETGAALAAMAQAEITGSPGACLTTLGPGAASAVNGVACAWLDRAPLVVFTDTQPPGDGAVFEHQRLDHAGLFSAIAKTSATLAIETARQSVVRALWMAITDRPGPVHIDCPGGIAAAEAPLKRAVDVVAIRQRPAPPVWDEVGPLLARARKPLVIAGLGARQPEDAHAIRALCEHRRIPAMVTYKGKGIVPDGHPWFAGVFTNAVIEQAIVGESDLVIGVGLDPVELLPRPWSSQAPALYLGRWDVETSHVPFVATALGEVPGLVAEIAARLTPSDWDASVAPRTARGQRDAVALPAEGLTAQQVVEATAAAFSEAARVTVDAGAHMIPATLLWPVSAPNQMLISNGLSTMGFALPAAIGAAVIDRERPVVALTGDGGLLMCAGELATAVREQLRITIVVFNDASLSLIEIKQEARHLPAAGVALGPIDWAAMAAGFGVASASAGTPAELEQALAQARRSAGPFLIDARIDRSNYADTLRAVRG